jgi:hypothetical protein
MHDRYASQNTLLNSALIINYKTQSQHFLNLTMSFLVKGNTDYL